MAHKLEELPVFSHAEDFTVAVTATLRRSRVRKDCDTYKQIVEANDSILANMQEGFEQGTDEAFAKYLYYSKGSIAEVMRRLRSAARRNEVDQKELDPLAAKAETVCKMLGGLIKYLKRSGFKDRGRFKASQQDKGN
jgi:four helix bundle protein